MIPCRNASSTLEEQLTALASQSWDKPWEVIVVDDASTDNSVDIARRFANLFERFSLIHVSGAGPAGARNAGAAVAKGEYVAFCDADDVVSSGWLPAIGDAVSKVNFVAGPLDPSVINDSEVALARGIEKKPAIQNSFYFLPHAYGANLAVRKEIHDRVGGFDPAFQAGEDADYCWRLQLTGTPLEGADGAVVFYRYPSNWLDTYRQGVNWAAADVQLHRTYDPQGMPPLRITSGLKGWVRLVLSIPTTWKRTGRLRFARLLGYRVGRLKGAWRFRYPTL